MKHHFVDAQQMAKEHPATFEAPTQEDLNNVEVNDYVKVCHKDERFWVLVTQVDGDKVTGEVYNDLVKPHPFNFGSTIEFELRHIYQTNQFK